MGKSIWKDEEKREKEVSERHGEGEGKEITVSERENWKVSRDLYTLYPCHR